MIGNFSTQETVGGLFSFDGRSYEHNRVVFGRFEEMVEYGNI